MHWIAASLFAVVISLTSPLALAFAQDCQGGDLDKAYCDRSGNLVADPPSDSRQLVNPSTLIFAYTPVEDPAVYLKTWDGFIKHMEKTTGKKVVFFPVQSNAAEIEAMRSGRLHVAGFNTGSVPIAVNCAGFVPSAIMGTQAGQFGYEMEIIVPADSAIKTPADLKGKKVAFTSPTSNSGFKAPSAILAAEFNLVADRDFTPVFSGKHDNSVIGVANKDYDAAAIANEVMFRMFERNVANKRADELSGGQRQRVGICRALIQAPELLLVDEPTASLDPKTSRQIMRLIKELCAERKPLSAIINIHDVVLAQTFAERIVGLRFGEIVYDGPSTGLTAAVLTQIYGEEDWSATVGKAEEGDADKQIADHAIPLQAPQPDRDRLAGLI